MKLLILTNNPGRASFRQRIGIYLDMLRDNGVNCEVARFPSGSLARWKLLRQSRNFDAVFLHKKRLNPLDAYWLICNSKKIIYDFDDAVMYDDKNPDRPSSKRQKSFERTVRLAHLVTAGNSYLAGHARKFNTNVEILATGLCLHEYHFSTKQKKNDNIRLVWVGSQNTLKYLAQLKPALEEIGSRFDNVILRIIADDFFDLQKMQVEKCFWSLEKQGYDLATCDIGLAPLPDNRFTRGKCGFKILQYLAASLPVVASPVGVNSIYVRDNVDGFLADNHRAWVNKLCRLISDSQLRDKMGQAGSRAVKQFDIEQIGNQLCDLVKQCIKGRIK